MKEIEPAIEVFDTKNLEKIIRALKKGGNAGVKIGIFGKNAARQGSDLNNATIGAFHEFGTIHVPKRSFLKMPITERLKPELEKSGAFDEATIKEVVKLGTIKPWLDKVAITAEAVVMDAFDTGGFGKWTPSDMTHKQNQQTLVETQQLRNSITTEVVGIG